MRLLKERQKDKKRRNEGGGGRNMSIDRKVQFCCLVIGTRARKNVTPELHAEVFVER